MLDYAEEAIAKIEDLLKSGITLSVGVSFGKDSTSVLCLVVEALLRLQKCGITHERVYVTTANTKRENAAMDFYAQGMSLELIQFIALNKLNMEFVEVTPSLSGSFIWTVIGRGKFVRYPNLSRDCSVDEKIRPQQKFVKQIEGEVISLIGSRSDESSHRANSLASHKMDADTVVTKDGQMTFAIIANWDLLDVWEWLTTVDNSDGYGCKFFHSLDLMSQLYRDANDGVCGVIKEGVSSACGSRFGCQICCASGQHDKSLKSMLDEAPEKYGFMKGYIAIQEWLFNIRFDLTKREFRGRRIKQVGEQKFISVAPDYYDADTKLELLRYLITLDAVEIERARLHEEAFYNGDLERNEWNEALCYPMFEMITKDSILAIDFAWSIGRDFRTASMAAKAYMEIHHLKKRYYPPVLTQAEKPVIPAKRWIDVTELEARVGLNDPYLKNGEFKELIPTHSAELAISAGGGFSYINAIQRHFNELDKVDISETARAAIANNWITMPRKEFNRYHQIAVRNELLFRAYNEEIRLVFDEDYQDDVIQTLPGYLNSISISDSELKLLESNQLKIEVVELSSDDLFGAEGIIEAKQAEIDKKVLTRKAKKVPFVETHLLSTLTASSRQLSIQM